MTQGFYPPRFQPHSRELSSLYIFSLGAPITVTLSFLLEAWTLIRAVGNGAAVVVLPLNEQTSCERGADCFTGKVLALQA